ncbi:MAG: GtrA family protein [Patescibacteria group bacterium]|jgi:putative flippase GtrA
MTISPWLKQIIRFLLAGAPGVILYYVIYYVLTDVCGILYLISAAIAWVINFGSNFLLQKYWTFENKTSDHLKRQAGAYALFMIFVALANLGLLYALVDQAHFHHLVAQVIVTIVLTVVSYFISRRIFK